MGKINDIIAKVKQTVSSLGKRSIMKQIGRDLTKEIVRRTRLGRGVKEQGSGTVPLKPLAASYKKQRQRLRRRSTLSSKTTPAKSNLTKTGEMLDDMTFTTRPKEVEIFFRSQESRRKAQIVQDQGREFMKLSKKEITDIAKIIEAQLKKALSKL